MKNFIKIFVFILLLLFPMVTVVFAQEEDSYAWYEKLGRGLINIATSPLDIGKEIYYTIRDENAVVGLPVGLIRGVGATCMRLGTGAVDFVTFPANWPTPHKAPMLDPEFGRDSGRTTHREGTGVTPSQPVGQ